MPSATSPTCFDETCGTHEPVRALTVDASALFTCARFTGRDVDDGALLVVGSAVNDGGTGRGPGGSGCASENGIHTRAPTTSATTPTTNPVRSRRRDDE